MNVVLYKERFRERKGSHWFEGPGFRQKRAAADRATALAQEISSWEQCSSLQLLFLERASGFIRS